jgi:serine/threonine protein kinase/Tol biopolymer transport system component
VTPERHQLVCDLLYQALELEASERESFLSRACSADTSLREEVDSLLASSENVRSNFLQSSAHRLTLTPGTKLGDYEVESLLGSGGMGEVYRARDLRLAREVAIKVLPSYVSSDRKQLWRFEQEARAAAALSHPNILAVFQMGEHQGAPYLVSELLEGETLRELIERGPLAVHQAVNFGIQMGKGLAAAHEKGIVHRDLKPENLFVTTDGRVKILDFGLAKLTRPNWKGESATETGVVMGTLGYMSPEQARGQTADARADIFAFGVVLYEMLTGRRAFQRATAADTVSAILNQDPPAISRMVPRSPLGLQRVVQRCLAKNPEQRFQHASDLLGELETLPTGRDRSILKSLAAIMAALFVIGLLTTQNKPLRDWGHKIVRESSPAASTQLMVTERNLTANLQDNPVTAAAISRDGKFVAYTDHSKTVNLLLVDSGNVHPLTLDPSYEPVDWFPDGIHLLTSHIGGEPGLWKFSTWDSSLQKLWEGPVGSPGGEPVRNAAVSPDGSSIAFIKDEDAREVWLMGAEGEEPHKILDLTPQDSVWNLAWSPDGRRLAYIRLRGSFAKHESVIESFDLNGNARSTVLTEPMLWGRDGVAGISWLADGRIVYAISTKLDEYNLWSIKAGAGGGGRFGQPEPLTNWREIAAPGFQASADGKRLIALKRHSESAIYVGALASGSRRFNAKRLLADSWRNVGSAWTKDSRSILINSKRNGRWAIFKRPLDVEMPEALIGGAENYRDPVSTVTGRLLYNAFTSADVETDAGNWRLMSTPIDGGPRSILMSGRYTYDCPSRHSAACVVADLKDKQLVFSSLDPVTGKGGELARVSYRAGDVPHWSLSPDGRKIAMVETGVENGNIEILSLADSKITSLPVPEWKWKYLTSICWAADGQRLFAITLSESSSALISIDPSGKLAALYEVDPGQAWIGLPIASPDGRFLAFTKRTYASDLVMVENF